MIAFGCSIISPDAFQSYAEVGIRRAREADSDVFALQAAGSIFRSYNLILDLAAAREDLEALVLVHEDAEIVDASLCEKIRSALSDPEVAVVGCAGAVGVRSIAWWDGSAVGSVALRIPGFGGVEVPGVPSNGGEPRGRARSGEVDTVDGTMIAISPWAVRNVRFDESLGPHWGYDFDYCLQVRAARRKVVVADITVAHHHSVELVGDSEQWIAAHMRAAEKWEGRMPNAEPRDADWKRRARRAEAEAVVARLQAAAKVLQADARTMLNTRRLEEVTDSASWRLTEPLRRVNAWRRSYTQRRR